MSQDLIHGAQAELSELVVESRIRGDAASVWRALTDDIGTWWPAAIYVGGDPAERSFRFDPRPGGYMIEDWGDQGGLLWAQVLHLETNKALTLSGLTSPRWGGPSTWIGEITLEEVDDHVLFRFRETAVGRTDAKNEAGKTQGWSYLFDGALRAHVEGREEPTWEDWAEAHHQAQ
ncbi:MAG: SRPBCC domain-containing protein [Acidobacteriota bacterium]